MAKAATARASANGTTPDPLQQAIQSEQEIAQEAEGIRREASALTPLLFMDLWELLRRPIPEGFIVTTGVVKGKPYDSTGIKSIQVVTDRMDNVLSPLWWWDEVEYQDAGKICRVTVHVGSDRRRPLVSRSSYGGVNQGSTQGNIYKGSYTNAAKRAFAQIGVGHEVYLGATDLDPDVSEDAAKAQEGAAAGPERKLLNDEQAGRLANVIEAAGLTSHLPARLRAFGVSKLTELDSDQATRVYEWAHGEGSSG